jgi:hypothetical protein
VNRRAEGSAAVTLVFVAAIIVLEIVIIGTPSSTPPPPQNPIPGSLGPGTYVYANQTCTFTTTLNGTQYVGVKPGNETVVVMTSTSVTTIPPFFWIPKTGATETLTLTQTSTRCEP